MPLLKNWSLNYKHSDIYQAPELYQPVFIGNIYEDDRFDEGTLVITSPIVSKDKEKRTITTKSGTIYKLGDPSANYEKRYPNAKERFFSDSD